MPVDVELFGQLSTHLQRHHTLILERETTVHEVVSLLGLDEEVIGVIVIDGVQSEFDDLVSPDCRLCFFPPLSGG